MFAVKHLAWIMFSSNNAAEYNDLLKKEGIAAKQLQTIFRDDLATIYEVQVLRNRSFDVVDWEKEKYNRTETNTVNVPSSKVFAIARQIFEEAKSLGCKPISMPWQDYWDARWVSMPGGSVVSQYEEDKTLKKTLPRQARVKSAWFASNMHNDYAYWENRQQGIYASTSTKYEWGKVRALYGCDVTSFLHSDHSMKNCEDVMPNYFPVGSKANSKYVNQVIQYFSNGVPFCFDYDDFNSQHSTASMRSVLYAWQEVFSNNLTTTQQQSLQWTIDSLDDVKIEFNELGQQVNAEGTLLSGWRLTSFMNTVLNRVYLMMCDIKEHSIYALHNGDDMFATTTSVYEALQVVKKAKKLGVRAQLTKTNIGTIGEFLRVDTRATNPTGSQYLSRSIATAVHGRVETGAPNDFFELVSAHRTRAQAIIDRGGKKPIVEVMLKRQLKFACKLFKQDPEIIGLWESLHPMQGGCNIEAGEKEKRIQRVFSTEKGSDYHRIFNAIKGVDDYVDMITRKFKLTPEKVSKKRVREKAADMLMSRLTNYEIVIEDRPRISNYIGLYGAYKSSTFIVPLSKLRSVGMATVEQLMNLPSYISRMVAKSADPIMYMTAVF